MTKKLSIVSVILLMLYLLIPEEKVEKKEEIKEIRGVFISYIELGNYIKDKNYRESITNLENMIKNVKENKFNTIYIQVRSHMDSIYKSDLFPVSKNIVLKDETNYDVLKKIIELSNKENIDVYAWINPYRIGTNITKDCNYYNFVENDIKLSNGIYYLNPASESSTNLIVKGVEEIIKNYKVKGILFDDYFYPDNEIDLENYNETNKDISIEQYRLNNINNMVYQVNKRIKEINKNILFGISPDANIDNNYTKEYIDVKTLGKDSKYVDFLMPQIYYGFENETKPFEEVVKEWKEVVTNKKIKLLAALAFYKTGTQDKYAKKGEYEWINNTDIIKREVLKIREEKDYSGFSIFRYDNLFNEDIMNENSKKEKDNLKEIM